MQRNTCRDCRRVVYWGARKCPYCSCESPTLSELPGSKRRGSGGDVLSRAEEPSVLGGWWWIVLLFLIAGPIIFTLIYNLLDNVLDIGGLLTID